MQQQTNDYGLTNKIYRKPLPPPRIYCHNCKEYTLATEPILVRRYAYAKFYIVAQCEQCRKLKSFVKADYEQSKFPSYFFTMKPNNFVKNELGGKRFINEISHIING